MQLQDYVNDVQELIHDSSGSAWPLNRVISRINEARLDAARDMHCVRQVVTGVQLLQGQEVYNLNGAVVGANVAAGGTGYGAGPTAPVTFSAPPPGGTQALAVGNITSGALSSITMTQWGSGYVSQPTITIGGIGTGAAATAVTLFNTLSVVSISIIWTLLNRYNLGYMDFTMFQAYFRMFGSIFQNTPAKFSHHQQGQQIYIQPPPNQVYLSDWDVISLPQNLINLSDVDTQLIDPWARAVQFRASELLFMKMLNGGHPLSEKYGAKYESHVPRIITTSGGIRIPNPYDRTFQRRVSR